MRKIPSGSLKLRALCAQRRLILDGRTDTRRSKRKSHRDIGRPTLEAIAS